MRGTRPEEDPFVRAVRRQAERAAHGRGPTFWEGLRYAGAVGWMVVIPAVLGALAGRVVDRRYGTGISWTLSLLLIGVVLGCISAWRHVRSDLGG